MFIIDTNPLSLWLAHQQVVVWIGSLTQFYAILEANLKHYIIIQGHTLSD